MGGRYPLKMLALATPLFLAGCASPAVAPSLAADNSLTTQRWIFLGILAIAFILQAGICLWLDRPLLTSIIEGNWPMGLIGPLLLWTKLAEWGYHFLTYCFQHWPGIVVFVNGFLTGIVGGTGYLLFWLLQFGFAYPAPDLVFAVIYPALIGLGIHFGGLLFLVFRKVID